MRFIRFIFIVGYTFWAIMFLVAFSNLMLRNAWIDLFEIQKVIPKTIEFIPVDENSTEISYEFEYNQQRYLGSRKVINQIIKDRLPKDTEAIEVSFNTIFPKANYLDQLGLKTIEGNVGLVISIFFLTFLLLIDLFAEKKKWLRIYGLDKKNKC